MNIDEFAEELRQEVIARSGDEDTGHFREDRFTEIMLEYLEQASEVDDGEVCYHRNTHRGEKLNAFGLSAEGEYVDLFVSLYQGSVPPESVPNSDVNTHFRWLRRFFEAALGGVHKDMEESSPVFDAAQQIHAAREDLTKARFFLLTDGVTKSPDVEPFTVGGIEVRHFIWDLEKLRRFIASRMRRETIEIDFEKDFGGPVPCLEAPTGEEYRTFLTFFPGELLASLYGEYGPRLLEKNVRSFLQAKGKINKGIRKTLTDDGEAGRFLAYNNGISATAEDVEIGTNGGVPQLRRARDFQIVNGGQTTASIYHALKRDRADLSKVTVQVKLTVLNKPEDIARFVPLISQYANSQNKVNAADFSANAPYHVALEELSRRVWAPSSSGTERQTHWYYERARGSYLDDKGREGTPARMRAFEGINPLRQKFTKTDLAKYENTWDQYPHLVSQGAEKNFIKFTADLVERGYPAVDEDYFQRLVAKAILFKAAEKLVGAQGYGGFRAQIVTYTLAWLSHRTSQRIDLDEIWKTQKLSDGLRDAIVAVSKFAHDHIVNPPPNRKNPGEWCKREECWEQFRQVSIKLPSELDTELLDTGRPASSRRNAPASEQTVTDPEILAAIERVGSVPGETWFNISHWAKETDNLQPWQRGLSFSLGRMAGKKPPSPKQAVQAMKILEEAERRGFRSET